MNEDWTHRDRDDEPLAEAVGRLRAARMAAPGIPAQVLHAVDAAIDAAAEADHLTARGGAGAGVGTSADVVTARTTTDAVDASGADDAPRAGRDTTATDGSTPADGLRDRLAHRREATAAARQAAATYAAIHGHVPGGSEDELQAGTRRWALRPRTALVAVCAVLLLAAGLAVTTAWPRGQAEEIALAGVPDAPAEPQPGASPAAPATEPSASDPAAPDPAASASASASVVVDVVGQVHNPGLVTLPEGSRVFDAVAAAGGATDGAELSAINLARPVVDGEQLRVPAPGEVVAEPPAPAAGGDGGGLVNLNTADEATLDTLPGIGPALAARIVAWRTDNGPFASVDELDDVSGIGPAMLAKVRDLVTV